MLREIEFGETSSCYRLAEIEQIQIHQSDLSTVNLYDDTRDLIDVLRMKHRLNPDRAAFELPTDTGNGNKRPFSSAYYRKRI